MFVVLAGKLAKMVVNTFSSLGDNEDDFDDKGSHISDDEDHLVGLLTT